MGRFPWYSYLTRAFNVSPLSTDRLNVGAVENLEREPEAGLQLVLPLLQHPQSCLTRLRHTGAIGMVRGTTQGEVVRWQP